MPTLQALRAAGTGAIFRCAANLLVATSIACTGNIAVEATNQLPGEIPEDAVVLSDGGVLLPDGAVISADSDDGNPSDMGMDPASPQGDWFAVDFEAMASDPKVRMLTNREFKHRIDRALGIDSDIAALPRTPQAGFLDNHAPSLRISNAQHAKALLQLASDAAEATPNEALAACNLDCSTEDVEATLEMLYARQPLESEVNAAHAAYEDARANAVPEPARAILQWALMSPGFLYRMETMLAQDNLVLPQLAAKLSFFLTGAAPDAPLLQAVREGTLSDPGVYASEVDRLMETDAFADQLQHFFSLWLNVDEASLSGRDTENYDVTIPEMRAEFEAIIDHVLVEENGTLEQALAGTRSWVSESLARLYSVPRPSGEGLQEVDLSASERRGLLTSALVLVANSKAGGRSPIRWGHYFVDLTCSAFPAASGDPAMTLPGDDNLSLRERFEVLERAAPCSNCHQTLNAGFAFDAFDSVGRRRDPAMFSAAEIRGPFLLPPFETVEFDGPVDAAEKLARHGGVRRCFVAQVYRYAQGRMLGKQDIAAFDGLLRSFESDARPLELFRNVAMSDAFRYSGELQ